MCCWSCCFCHHCSSGNLSSPSPNLSLPRNSSLLVPPNPVLAGSLKLWPGLCNCCWPDLVYLLCCCMQKERLITSGHTGGSQSQYEHAGCACRLCELLRWPGLLIAEGWDSGVTTVCGHSLRVMPDPIISSDVLTGKIPGTKGANLCTWEKRLLCT